MKKTTAFIFLLAFFLSCKSEKKKETTDSSVGRKDSITAALTEHSVNPYVSVDVSPMDMAYFPEEYPKLKMTKSTQAPPLARVIYSRPHLAGRVLFRDLQKYGERWRMGANEATELDLYADATIANQTVKAGRYILYCIPQADHWDVVLNSNIDTWGLEQDTALDVARFRIPVKHVEHHVEYFTMLFEKTKSGANLLMTWDSVEARLPFKF
jgi:hypothetical protein